MCDDEEGSRANLILEVERGQLWLGDKHAATDPLQYGCTCVLNCAPTQVKRCGRSLDAYAEIDLKDAPIVCANGQTSFDDAGVHFSFAKAFIDDCFTNGRNVLIHCAGGVSRSATIVISYLVSMTNGMPLSTAYAHCQARRGVIGVNAGFFNQLCELEEKVHGRATMARALNMHQRSYKPLDKP
jgi:hypothetical protein